MPTYLIEREIPGATELTDEELRGITATSNDAVTALQRPTRGPQLRRRRQDLLRAPGRERRGLLEHARRGGFPANLVAEVSACFDSTGPRPLPV